MTWLVPLPVVMPLLGAALTLLLVRRPRAQRTVSLTVLTATLVVACALLWLATGEGALVVAVGGWGPLGIVLVADQLAALMCVVSAAVTLCVLVYSIGQGMADGDEETPLSVYHPTYLILTAGVMNAFLSGDLFNLYVGFEILLVASYVLLTLGSTAPRIRAGTTYVVVSLLSSLIFLTAIGLVYAATGTLNLAQLVGRLDALPDGLRLVLQAMLLLAFGIKAAVFPLSAWLPDSYPTAPAPVTAVFAGLLTKVGVYAIIRTETLLFPGGRVADLLMIVALLTMVVGILGAVAQADLKRLLSFTLISHIGYMLFGVGLSTGLGLSSAIFYVVHHIVVQTTLFLAAGLVERRGGSTALDRLGGLARVSPLLAVLFLVPALNLAGIPPFSGFLGKLGLLQAGVETGGPLAWTLVAGGVVTSLLTLYAIARVWNLAFWRTPHPSLPAPGPTRLMPRMMVGSTLALVVFGAGLTLVAGPLFDVSATAAEDLLQRTPYVSAVIP
ncbi:Na+/H+ antiporter subunit D [Spirilliplanes yamanashiensis]|uniref:Putative cation antiporter NADH dehydrogenase subunit n=1 Tax=Spirilliplanes yamanashiensis TaxID=42233 RepID=A0A8J3YCY4_9ACTN|nr:Na+/H+ antiporter subunit D [Spirilliplanes yamanashiensis]MDP9819000.1 multicomponent Na+:H+ antiporter subunit D [Spirilliplanes yamanashiensis]GIJ05455.1 putative cation antiporter NADH dehydrogenase subunit [Spirilliplanes yamanashiensis]